MKAKTILLWALSAYIAAVFVQSLFFKFTGAPESIYIFSTLRDWSGISLFEPAGRWIIGLSELTASLLLFVPRTRIFGAALAIGIMSGAIFFIFFSPIGVVILGDWRRIVHARLRGVDLGLDHPGAFARRNPRLDRIRPQRIQAAIGGASSLNRDCARGRKGACQYCSATDLPRLPQDAWSMHPVCRRRSCGVHPTKCILPVK